MQNCSSVSTHFKVLLIILLWPHFGGSSSSLDIDLTKKSKKKKKNQGTWAQVNIPNFNFYPTIMQTLTKL